MCAQPSQHLDLFFADHHGMAMDDLDVKVRLRAFEFLEEQVKIHPEFLPRDLLNQGFNFDGMRVPLLGPQGIFKPAILDRIPLSFTTTPVVEGQPPPYKDEIGTDGLMRYRYRGRDPMHRDNVGLRLAMKEHVPLIYFFGLVPGRYIAVWPAFIVGDDPRSLTFVVEVGEKQKLLAGHEKWAEGVAEPRRAYLTVLTQQRLHQRGFRERVIRAYRQCCAVCRLKHAELLDAAHILPDGHPKGEPIIPNGLALCKLHHAAFDNNILGVSADLRIEIREDILLEHDGPMLTHGLQECHGKLLVVVPSARELRPRREFLEERFEIFRSAG